MFSLTALLGNAPQGLGTGHHGAPRRLRSPSRPSGVSGGHERLARHQQHPEGRLLTEKGGVRTKPAGRCQVGYLWNSSIRGWEGEYIYDSKCLLKQPRTLRNVCKFF